jgi:hypothetical protein
MRADNDNRGALPIGCPPRGLRRAAAAAYLGISPSHFDKQRALGEIPAPRRMFGVEIYDRHDLDFLFDGKPGVSPANDNNIPEANAWEKHWQDTASLDT